MVHICEAFTRYGGDTMQEPDCPEIVDFCLRALEQNRVSYPIAGPLQQMFRSSLIDQGLSLPVELTRQVRAAMQYSSDELLDACTRPTYRLPVSQIVANMEPDLGHNFMDLWNESAKGAQDGLQRGKNKTGKQMNIQDMLNG